MIRINLLGVERQKGRKAAGFNIAQSVPALCAAVFAVTVLGIGWWYWSLMQGSARVDADIVAAHQEADRLKSVMVELAQFDTRSKQLQERVTLIERLRGGQSIPVQLLDHVSRSLPDMMWLTSVEQNATGVTIQGKSINLIALSDFVSNLGNSAVLQKPVEIVKSEVTEEAAASGQPAADLINFTVRAQVAGTPGAEAPAKAR